jgi:hypothetical protein
MTFQSSLRGFSIARANPGLRPGLSSAVPTGLDFERVVLTLTLWPVRYVIAMIVLKSVPQGLKALIDAAYCGTAEAMLYVQSGRRGQRYVVSLNRQTPPLSIRGWGAILRACTRYELRRPLTRLLLRITGDGCLWMPDGRTTGFWM